MELGPPPGPHKRIEPGTAVMPSALTRTRRRRVRMRMAPWDRALRQAGRRRHVAMAGLRRRAPAGRQIPEIQIDQKRRRPAVVQHEIGQQACPIT